jgi:hypothetical protein
VDDHFKRHSRNSGDQEKQNEKIVVPLLEEKLEEDEVKTKANIRLRDRKKTKENVSEGYVPSGISL